MLPEDTDWNLFVKMSPMLADGFAPPDVVASVIAMLASDDGKFVTGTDIRIDGGAHA
jgi:NAD(P)-dependent dehydrogenase (short-subunit alcohol dehydrogenase family)